MATEAQKKQFIMGNIVATFNMNDENYKAFPEYDILSKLYYSANLYNNKALVKRLEKGRTITGRIQNMVYLDMTYIVAEKIVEDTTGFLKDIYVSYFTNKYPYVKRIFDNTKPSDSILEQMKKVSKEYERALLLALISLKYDLDEMESLNFIAKQMQYNELIFIDDNIGIDKYSMVLGDGTNIIETGAFEKYKAKRIGEICEYLGIEEKQFREYFVEEMKIVDSEEGTVIKNSNGSFEHILTGRILSNHCGGTAWASTLYAYNRRGRKDAPYEPDTDEVINAYFSALFLRCRADDSKANNRVSMMREYKSGSPETEWRGLCHAYQMDRIIKMMMNLQRNAMKIFHGSTHLKRT